MRHKNTDSFDRFLLELNTGIKQKEIIFFCGAGISRHSGLPLANDLVQAILAKLDILPEEIETITNSGLPFEAFIETLIDNSEPNQIIEIFDLGKPNTNHFLLAKLAKAGYVTTIFTTNFDLRVTLTSHELGHNWNARHCNGDLDCGIMCSIISGCNGIGDQFGSTSIAVISSYRDALSCLTTLLLPIDLDCNLG